MPTASLCGVQISASTEDFESPKSTCDRHLADQALQALRGPTREQHHAIKRALEEEGMGKRRGGERGRQRGGEGGGGVKERARNARGEGESERELAEMRKESVCLRSVRAARRNPSARVRARGRHKAGRSTTIGGREVGTHTRTLHTREPLPKGEAATEAHFAIEARPASGGSACPFTANRRALRRARADARQEGVGPRGRGHGDDLAAREQVQEAAMLRGGATPCNCPSPRQCHRCNRPAGPGRGRRRRRPGPERWRMTTDLEVLASFYSDSISAASR